MCYLIQELANMQAVKEAEIPQGAICQTIPEVQLKEAGNQLTEEKERGVGVAMLKLNGDDRVELILVNMCICFLPQLILF